MATTALHLYGSTGKPWSFSPKDELIVTDTSESSFIQQQAQSISRKHFFPETSSFFGPIRFSHLFRGLRLAGA